MNEWCYTRSHTLVVWKDGHAGYWKQGITHQQALDGGNRILARLWSQPSHGGRPHVCLLLQPSEERGIFGLRVSKEIGSVLNASTLISN